MKNLQNLPIGKSSFESIRENNDLYVDKTQHIFNLVSQGMYYFLSRPRRFGKSLTISTLRCLFQGKKELFKGLWIDENTDWEWKEHPVILLDFNGISHDTPENLKISLQRSLEKSAELYNLISDAPLLKNQFKELIISLNKKTGMPVVILIDEYDKPIIDHLGKGEKALETAKANRDILKSFFGVIKEGEVSDVLRFVFITGVSKFSRISIFSELNNLKDLTMTEDYADMLGCTQKELETCFAPYFSGFAQKQKMTEPDLLEKLRQHYNGYRFSVRDARVYNPFSILNAVDEKNFNNYWFETGTPTFLVNLLHENNWYLPSIENMEATEALFSVYEIERLQPEAILFQTGYVTIKDIDEGLYTFDYPNREVKTSFSENLFYSYFRGQKDVSRFILLSKYLRLGDMETFIEIMKGIYASIPYTIESKRDEAYFHTIFYLMVSASGIDARSEILTCKGRIDLVIEFSDKLYIIEFKCNQTAKAGIEQIRQKGYAEPYRQTGKKIILMGINFDTEKRNISEWKTEEI
ncbi:AAA ATPase-like domain-containing protein [Desulfonema limicola]|uniref:AAA ATPase-like domain-containing protein n=1 Tax=Desulfonema limicola TaxID=45656 RepID=A0A975BA36_9BACT|nr:ATP-binding protein [Desulfonema limicola]QTA81531.1 AAA ATPase-like domain-containing protein [Desulfonema limicola]